MDNTNENPTPPALTERPFNETNSPHGDPSSGIANPETNFLRRLISRTAKFLNDPVKKLTGAPRLTAELLARTGKILAPKSCYDEIAEWQRNWDALQKTINGHDDVAADNAFEKQQKELHTTVNKDGHKYGHILTRDEFREKYGFIRESARAQQRELYKKYIFTARHFAFQAADILRSHAIGLDAEEKDRFETYGLPYTGSPLVAAVRKAEKFVLTRVAQDEGEAGPDLQLPWLIQ
jgi:hypothetical protein